MKILKIQKQLKNFTRGCIAHLVKMIYFTTSYPVHDEMY